MQSKTDGHAGPALAGPRSAARALLRFDRRHRPACHSASSDLPRPREGEAPAGDAPPIIRVAVHTRMEEVVDIWDRLQARAVISPYQRRDWVLAWLETEGRRTGVTPMIVVAHDAAGEPIALLPFGVGRTGGLRRASFLGGRHTNYNMGLFDPRWTWTATQVTALLRRAGRAMPGGVDLYVLIHQPSSWAGFANPLAVLPHAQPSPSNGHRAILQPDGEAFLKAHQSSAARKKLRAKAGHLAVVGAVAHRVARTPAEVEAVVTAHIAQKQAKLAALGIAAPDAEALRELLLRACLPEQGDNGPAPVELHALHCGDAIVATFGGLAHAGRFSGLLISYALDPAVARTSPGELLLAAVIKAKCAEGFDGLDLGVGEARYKDSYCPMVDPLTDSFLPLTFAGRLAMLADAALLRAKAAVKHSPRAWSAVGTLRKTFARWRGVRIASGSSDTSSP